MTELFLCAKCAQIYKAGYEVKELRRDIRKKYKCSQCGRPVYGADYEISGKSKEEIM